MKSRRLPKTSLPRRFKMATSNLVDEVISRDLQDKILRYKVMNLINLIIIVKYTVYIFD